MSAPFNYPVPSTSALYLEYVGKSLQDVQTPALVLDRAIVQRNCQVMLDACDELQLGFRAHVKTHKTTEVTKLQVGTGPVKLVTSTVSEVENLLPWLMKSKTEGKTVNVLYGLPISRSSIPRLANVASTLGVDTVGVFVDHVTHVEMLDHVDKYSWPGPIPIWVFIDVGYHREGAMVGSKQLADLANKLKFSQRVRVAGFYTHMGNSYSSSNPGEALEYLRDEIEGLEQGALEFLKMVGMHFSKASKIVLSLGATPTATSVQNLFDYHETAGNLRKTISRVQETFDVELHAGVYPLLDMQQLATRARPSHSISEPDSSLLSFSDLGARTLVEVVSVYADRDKKPEALVAAGSLALGREPCKSYPGWGVVSPWPEGLASPHYDPEQSRTGWIVGRISQEHGVLTWEGSMDHMRELKIGDKLLIWPNHACIAGAGFGWYLVVDSKSAKPDKVVDVWVRWRGW
ncbi:hypothetical protein K470DRAFT_269180 [Piedraia hortae CBS 480.64]|uniref:D-serine dehydratase n=1 Tax=Piedraia hortae CBS 480.64 TaxID=1314780 RepID=A0A6A7C404_9PEZI|nr:hypothetical protein K470DRAFT_269180 [Piedraia hortae CBS 480.64]